MFCVKCGNEMPDESSFCPKCGTKVGENNSKNKNPDKIKEKFSKENITKYVKNNKKKSIIIGVVGAVILLAIIGVIIFAILNSGKAAAYDQGIKFIADNNVKEAEESFEKAGDYADAPIFYAATKAADQLYNNNNAGEALTIIIDMLDKDNNLDNLKKYRDRESSKIFAFMVGEVYYANDNLSDADNFYSLTPITYKVFNHSTYERRATIALVGTWNINVKFEITDQRGGRGGGEAQKTMSFSLNGAFSDSGYPKSVTSNNITFWCEPGDGIWTIDTSKDGMDGNYYYYFNGDSSNTFTISSGVFTYSFDEDADASYIYQGTKIN